ncbi:hypothetical protein C8J57DRAFT_1257305 [Mycena rebaudengoi]|nr:hypothetical protein C8J57DRAFT_1257305 [Mycena rebaudengoi]
MPVPPWLKRDWSSGECRLLSPSRARRRVSSWERRQDWAGRALALLKSRSTVYPLFDVTPTSGNADPPAPRPLSKNLTGENRAGRRTIGFRLYACIMGRKAQGAHWASVTELQLLSNPKISFGLHACIVAAQMDLGSRRKAGRRRVGLILPASIQDLGGRRKAGRCTTGFAAFAKASHYIIYACIMVGLILPAPIQDLGGRRKAGRRTGTYYPLYDLNEVGVILPTATQGLGGRRKAGRRKTCFGLYACILVLNTRNKARRRTIYMYISKFGLYACGVLRITYIVAAEWKAHGGRESSSIYPGTEWKEEGRKAQGAL